jgi:hypothetical protein
MLEVEIDAVAEQEHLHERHQQRDHQAARIAPDLHDLLDGDRLERGANSSCGPPSARSPRPMSCTNTSSSVG